MAQLSISNDGSKLVENCIKMMKKPQNELVVGILMQMISEILGLPAVRPPNQAHVRDVIYFSDLLTNKYANYVI